MIRLKRARDCNGYPRMLKSHKRIFHAACLDCSPFHCRSRIIIFSELHSRATATMHLAKGLEFPGVVVMACDDDVLPLQARIEEVSDESKEATRFEGFR